MQCLNPITVTVAGRSFPTACGHCIACAVNKTNYLRFLCECEVEDCRQRGLPTSSFVTLTYDDAHIPVSALGFATLLRDDYRNYLKRVRRAIDYHRYDIFKNLRYLAAGEYGGKIGRPHYHFIFFGVDTVVFESLFSRHWDDGKIIDVKPALSGAVRYMCKYFTKQVYGTKKKELYDDNNIEAPFVSHSKALGANTLLTYIQSGAIMNNVNGSPRSLPACLRRKWFSPSVQQSVNTMLLQRCNEYALSVGYTNFASYAADLSKHRARELVKLARMSGDPIDDSCLYPVGSKHND